MPARVRVRLSLAVEVDGLGRKSRRRRAVIPVGVIEMLRYVDVFRHVRDMAADKGRDGRHRVRRATSSPSQDAWVGAQVKKKEESGDGFLVQTY